jgi:hypothetical protein
LHNSRALAIQKQLAIRPSAKKTRKAFVACAADPVGGVVKIESIAGPVPSDGGRMSRMNFFKLRYFRTTARIEPAKSYIAVTNPDG